MAKPSPMIRYRVGDGYIECYGEGIWIGHDPSDQYGGAGVEFADKAEAATVLFSFGKALLDQIGDSAVSKEVLLEAGLLEGSSNVTLRNVSNVMEVKQCNVTLLDKAKDENGEKDQPHSLLTEKVQKILVDSGLPADVIQYLGSLNGYASALNQSSNPVKAAQTMTSKEKFTANFQRWLETQKQ